MNEHNFTEMLNRLNKQNYKIKEKSIDYTSCRVTFRKKLKVSRKNMSSLTCLSTHLNKIQENLILILCLSVLLDQQ